jgi:hypothetical protein
MPFTRWRTSGSGRQPMIGLWCGGLFRRSEPCQKCVMFRRGDALHGDQFGSNGHISLLVQRATPSSGRRDGAWACRRRSRGLSPAGGQWFRTLLRWCTRQRSGRRRTRENLDAALPPRARQRDARETVETVACGGVCEAVRWSSHESTTGASMEQDLSLNTET